MFRPYALPAPMRPIDRPAAGGVQFDAASRSANGRPFPITEAEWRLMSQVLEAMEPDLVEEPGAQGAGRNLRAPISP